MNEDSKKRKCYVAWTNTDLTEGRGFTVPFCVCACRSTAERMGKGASIQGSNCTVTEEECFVSNGTYYGPIRLVYPSSEDEVLERKREEKERAEAKALQLGLSQEDIDILKR